MRSTLPIALDPLDLRGKRVLEIGPANGFYTFEMERRGAMVTACELSDSDPWDIIPHSRVNKEELSKSFQTHLQQLRNAFWFCHKRFESRSRVFHSSVYNLDLASDLGQFEVSTIFNVLLHLRDPFSALQRMAERTQKTIVIMETEPYAESRKKVLLTRLLRRLPCQIFYARAKDKVNTHTWWHLSPRIIEEFLKILGFSPVSTRFHPITITATNDKVQGYTVIANRTAS